jgi:3-oxoacyl-[acyl-carrier-protein] synthase III
MFNCCMQGDTAAAVVLVCRLQLNFNGFKESSSSSGGGSMLLSWSDSNKAQVRQRRGCSHIRWGQVDVAFTHSGVACLYGKE